MDQESSCSPITNMDTLLTAASIALPLPSQEPQPEPREHRDSGASNSSSNSQPDASPPQQSISGSKRTKVSRACDECRRKKIRCDIEARGNSCSSCQRANASCTFSRVQLKRGPSKRSRSHSEVLQGQRLFSQEQLPGINTLLSWRPEPLNLSQTQMAHGIPGQPPHPLPSPVFNCPPSQPAAIQTQQQPGLAGSQTSGFGQVKTEPGQPTQQPAPGWPANVSPRTMLLDVPSPQTQTQAQVQNPQPTQVQNPQAQTQQAQQAQQAQPQAQAGQVQTPHQLHGQAAALMAQQQHNRRGSLPVLTPTRSFDLDPFALSHYYQFWHPIFPILPDGPNNLHQLLALAPAVAPWLIAAINGQLFAMPIDSQRFVNDTQRAVQLMALMFIYLRTLDYTWLGAVIANALAIKTNGGGHGPRLYSIALVFDRLHSITHHYPQLIRDFVADPPSRSPESSSAINGNSSTTKQVLDPMLRELRLLELPNKEYFTPPPEPHEPAMAAFWWLGNLEGSASAKSELARLLPALIDSPIAGFMRKALS